MKNINTGNNSGIIGDGNIIVFNMQEPLDKKQVEEAFLKLENGDFQDITEEVDKTLYEEKISILSYTKNYWLQLKKQLVNNDFHEPWLPEVPADMGVREKKPCWKFTPIYQNIVLPFSYLFIEMDGGRYLIPLPKSEHKGTETKIDNNGSVKRYTITEVQYRLGGILRNTEYCNTSYDDMLKLCKIEIA